MWKMMWKVEDLSQIEYFLSSIFTSWALIQFFDSIYNRYSVRRLYRFKIEKTIFTIPVYSMSQISDFNVLIIFTRKILIWDSWFTVIIYQKIFQTFVHPQNGWKKNSTVRIVFSPYHNWQLRESTEENVKFQFLRCLMLLITLMILLLQHFMFFSYVRYDTIIWRYTCNMTVKLIIDRLS